MPVAVALSLLTAATAARPRSALPLEVVVRFQTVCSDCHAGEYSGRLSFDSGAATSRSHIERYLGKTQEAEVAALFAMPRHIKETCRQYPVFPPRPAAGSWEVADLTPWRNEAAGAYFIPLGRLPAGQRQLLLELDRPARGTVRIEDEQMNVVADEQFCREVAKTVVLDGDAMTAYFLH